MVVEGGFKKRCLTLMAKSPSLLSSSSMVLDTTLEQGSGCALELGLSFESFERSVLSPEIERLDITVVALLGVSIVDDGVTPSSGMYVGCVMDDDDAG